MTPQRPNLKIGDTVWRKYTWQSGFTIVGETSRSWLLEWPGKSAWEEHVKLPKASLPENYLLTEQEWIDWKFAVSNAYSIARKVESLRSGTSGDGALLRQVADLIGWKEETK